MLLSQTESWDVYSQLVLSLFGEECGLKEKVHMVKGVALKVQGLPFS